MFEPSHHVVIRVYDDAGNVIHTHEHEGDFAKHLSSASRARIISEKVEANRQSKLIGAPQADVRSKGLRPNVAVRASSSKAQVEDASATDAETTAISIG